MTDEYYLSRKEFAAIGEFMKKHEHADSFCLRYDTDFEIITHVVCCECDAEEDVTDYDEW